MENREIKFRLIMDNKIVGYEVIGDKGWRWMSLELNPDKGERWTTGVFPESAKYKRVQYTELKDKNGIEIYESDIVKYEACNCVVMFGFHKTNFLEQLASYDYAYGFYLYFNNVSADEPIIMSTAAECEVIGNIYEN